MEEVSKPALKVLKQQVSSIAAASNGLDINGGLSSCVYVPNDVVNGLSDYAASG